MKTIKGFENEDIIVSDFGEWVGKNYIDYKAEYKRNQKFIEILLKENQELKKQLEERNIEYFKGAYDTHDKYYTQQKEFIKYLEDESKEVYRDGGLRQNIFRQILQKYEEIIGDVKNENNNV